MALSLFLSSFYFGLLLCYRYALDAVVGGDFLRYDGDQAFNAIKKLIAASASSNKKIESAFENIHSRLESLESDLASFNETFKLFESVPMPFEPSGWVPSLKISIDGTIFYAHCDIKSEFCLMPKRIYDSLNLYELSKSETFVTLADNSIKLSFGTTQGVVTKIKGVFTPTDYHVIECVGNGSITLGRGLLRQLGAVIDMGEATLKFKPPYCLHHFPNAPKAKAKKKNKRSKGNTIGTSGLNNT